MSVTLDQIAQAIFSALVPLAPTRATPVVGVTPTQPPIFKYLGYWSGDIPRPNGEQDETWGKVPAAFVAFEGEAFQSNSAFLLTGDGETRSLSTWSVLVAVSDPRGATAELRGAAGTPGALSLCNQVILAVNGLTVPRLTATLAVKIAGTPNALVAFTSGNAFYELTYNGITFRPTVSGVSLDGSGNATINVQCTQDGAVQGALGNLMPNVSLAWTQVPTNLTPVATVVSTVTLGESGLLSNQKVYYSGTRVAGRVPGVTLVMAVRFTALREVDQVAYENTSTPFVGITGREHLYDPSGTLAPANADPIVVLSTP